MHMLISRVEGNYPHHAIFASHDTGLKPDSGYEVRRGMRHVLHTLRVDFNPYVYLRQLVWAQPGIKPRVLEGGCGHGEILADLKRGIYPIHPFSLDQGPIERTVNFRYPDPYLISEPGLGNSIHTTGVTLSEQHAMIIGAIDPSAQPDHLMIGPIGVQHFDSQAEMILDFYGAAFHRPEEALSVYSHVLKDSGLVLMRFPTNTDRPQEEVDRAIRTELRARSFESLLIGINQFPDPSDQKLQGTADVLARKITSR